MSRWQAVIGLEVHAQLMTDSKLFSAESTAFGAPPNSQVSAVCAGLPGSLPVLNGKAVELCLRAGAALNCQLQQESRFARKHYFYPDLPKGYQISQYEAPIFLGGKLRFPLANGIGSCSLRRIHLEEDAGKTIHREGYSLVDLNRAGVPLIEIVSEPELSSPEAVASYLRELRGLLRFLDICDGNMEEGSFRCDANVSIRRSSQTTLGTRTELKNLNSFRLVQEAIEYELERQMELLEEGGAVTQETRLYDSELRSTRAMRGKEEAEDYRYFPDPDLPPLRIPDGLWTGVLKKLPELPSARRSRYQSDWQLSPDMAEVIVQSRLIADYFETAAQHSNDPQIVARLLVNQILPVCPDPRLESDSPLPATDLGRLAQGVSEARFSKDTARRVLEKILDSPQSLESALRQVEGEQERAAGALEQVLAELLMQCPEEVREFRAGKEQLIGFFMGRALKDLASKADPGEVRQALLKALK